MKKKKNDLPRYVKTNFEVRKAFHFSCPSQWSCPWIKYVVFKNWFRIKLEKTLLLVKEIKHIFIVFNRVKIRNNCSILRRRKWADMIKSQSLDTWLGTAKNEQNWFWKQNSKGSFLKKRSGITFAHKSWISRKQFFEPVSTALFKIC